MNYPFPVEPHTYFQIQNGPEAYERFVADQSQSPVFEYQYVSEGEISRRLSMLMPESRQFHNLELVMSAYKFRSDPSVINLENYRRINANLYDEPSRAGALAVFSKIRSKVTQQTADMWSFIEDQIGAHQEDFDDISQPLEEEFAQLKGYLEAYADIDNYSFGNTLSEEIRAALHRTGLTSQGWSLVIRDDGSHARTNHKMKKIFVGSDYSPRRRLSVARIVLHEVYGHALRGPQDSIVESEGFATLLEQLASSKFTLKRSYRYLAASLGWGVMGLPMNFSEVYEIIWRSMVIMSKYTESEAKIHAFYECSRVFRGGVPAVAGSVFLKDSLYFSANMSIWQELVKQMPTYYEFVDMIEGRRKVLS